MSLEYFDDLSDLMESDESITEEDILNLVSETDRGTLDEILENYFTDMTKGVPDEQSDLDLLFENIQTYLRGLVGDKKEEKKRLSEELLRFRSWLSGTKKVLARRTDGPEERITVLEALMRHRLSLLGECQYSFDFSEALDFPMEAYDMQFGVSRIETEQEFETEEKSTEGDGTDASERISGKKQPVSLACECDDDDAEDYIDDQGWNTLINRQNPVIDGEFSDQDETY